MHGGADSLNVATVAAIAFYAAGAAVKPTGGRRSASDLWRSGSEADRREA